MLKLRFIIAIGLLFSANAFALDRSQIAESADQVAPLLNGMNIPNVTLKTADNAPVSLRAMVMQKPTIILFYRGGWCPYCNRQLSGLKNIEGRLVSLGYQVLAISPESPKRLNEQKLETEFAVTLLSDQNLDAISEFGIGFYVERATRELYREKMSVELTAEQSSDRAVLPAPAVFIVDQSGTIVFNYVNPDFRVRLSEHLLLQAAMLSI